MRWLLAVVLVGCSSAAAVDVASTGATTQADGVDAGPALPECNGTNTRHICASYRAAAPAQYGLLPSCTGTPFLPTDGDGGVAFRAGAQAGCFDVGAPAMDSKPAIARCCP